MEPARRAPWLSNTTSSVGYPPSAVPANAGANKQSVSRHAAWRFLITTRSLYMGKAETPDRPAGFERLTRAASGTFRPRIDSLSYERKSQVGRRGGGSGRPFGRRCPVLL